MNTIKNRIWISAVLRPKRSKLSRSGVSEQPPDSQPWFCAKCQIIKVKLVKLGSDFDIEVSKEFKECGKNMTQNRI